MQATFVPWGRTSGGKALSQVVAHNPLVVRSAEGTSRTARAPEGDISGPPGGSRRPFRPPRHEADREKPFHPLAPDFGDRNPLRVRSLGSSGALADRRDERLPKGSTVWDRERLAIAPPRVAGRGDASRLGKLHARLSVALPAACPGIGSRLRVRRRRCRRLWRVVGGRGHRRRGGPRWRRRAMVVDVAERAVAALLRLVRQDTAALDVEKRRRGRRRPGGRWLGRSGAEDPAEEPPVGTVSGVGGAIGAGVCSCGGGLLR